MTNPSGQSSKNRGHFWLNCKRPWTNRSVGATRLLSTTTLPGTISRTAGFKGTVCTPKGAAAILRIIDEKEDADVSAARRAGRDYEHKLTTLIARLGYKDFELLIDLVLRHSGWNRLDVLGKTKEGIDIDAENVVSNEIAFVQIKSVASRRMLDDYVSRFKEGRDRYSRMIFAVHTPEGNLVPPAGEPIQVWTGPRLAELVMKSGLAHWIFDRT